LFIQAIYAQSSTSIQASSTCTENGGNDTARQPDASRCHSRPASPSPIAEKTRKVRKEGLVFGSVKNVEPLQRLRERPDMAFIRDFGVMPNGSVWNRRYWETRDAERQIKMALKSGHLTYHNQ